MIPAGGRRGSGLSGLGDVLVYTPPGGALARLQIQLRLDLKPRLDHPARYTFSADADL